MAKHNIIIDSNGDTMTEAEYAATLSINTHKAYVIGYVMAHGSTTQAVLDAACSLPDFCAFEIEVIEARQRGDISEACESRLWKMGHEVWVWFAGYITDWGLTLEDTGVYNECWG